MVKMAPMLLICAKIFSAAAKIGTLAGLPIPLSIFGTTMQAAVEHAESYQNEMEQLVACNPDDMDGVNEIKRLEGETLEQIAYEILADRDLRADLFSFAKAQGLVMVELTRAQSNLEEVFRRLTRG